MRSRWLALMLLSCGPEATSPPPPVPTAVTAVNPPKFRLPTAVRPRRYDLDLTVDPNAPGHRGNVGIDLDVKTATDVIWLNATDLVIEKAALVREGKSTAVRVVPGGDDFVGFVMPAPVSGAARLEVSFTGKIDPEKAQGIYSQAESDGSKYVYTFFESTDARRAFPCFDEPEYKVPWALTLHVKNEHVARANSAIVSEKPEASGMKAVRFEETKPLPSYLVAFVVGPFDVLDAPDADSHAKPIHFIVPKGRAAEARYGIATTQKLVGFLETWFDVAYPYGKLDVAVVPRYWGTMEHPGIVAVGQPISLIKEETTSRKQFFAEIAGHELGHYWFGDYVTMKWWDDTWLNESLTAWIDMKVTNSIDPSWHYDRKRLVRAQSAMDVDSLPSAKRVRQPVLTKDDIETAFDAELTYFKGGAIMGMLDAWLGPARVQSAIRAYVKAHAWGNATADDLFASFDGTLGPQPAAVMKSFVEQPGLPLVHVEIACNGDNRTAVISQKRLVPQGMTLPSQTWKLPVCLRYGGATGAAARTCAFVDSDSTRVPLEGTTCPTWVMPNDDASGYYRVDYSKATLDTLLGTKGALRPNELVSVTSDANALVRIGTLGIDDAMRTLPSAFASGDSYAMGAAGPLVSLANRMAEGPQREKLAAFLRKTLGARAHALGWAPKAGESADDERLRERVLGLWAIRGRDPQTYREARGWADKWIADRKALAPEIAGIALHAGARTNDPKFFDAVLAEARRASRSEKSKLYSALGSFTAPELVERVQRLVLGHEDEILDVIVALETQLGDPDLHHISAKFFAANWDTLVSRLREDEVMWRLGDLTYPCDDAEADALKKLFGPLAEKIAGASRKLDRSVEQIHLCATLAKTNRAKLGTFLDKN